MNAVEMNDMAIKLGRDFEIRSIAAVSPAGMQRRVVKTIIEMGDAALSIAVRTKIKSETERKRFDALILLEGVE